MDKEEIKTAFNHVIKRAKLKGHLDAQDIRFLSSNGIPIIKICFENISISDVEKGFNGWFKSL